MNRNRRIPNQPRLGLPPGRPPAESPGYSVGLAPWGDVVLPPAANGPAHVQPPQTRPWNAPKRRLGREVCHAKGCVHPPGHDNNRHGLVFPGGRRRPRYGYGRLVLHRTRAKLLHTPEPYPTSFGRRHEIKARRAAQSKRGRK